VCLKALGPLALRLEASALALNLDDWSQHF